MGKNIEQLLKEADFSAGSDHKARLHDQLFGNKIISFPGERSSSMSTVQDFLEKFFSDKIFAGEVSVRILELKENGEKDFFSAMSKVASEYGYSITAQEVKTALSQTGDGEELSDDQLENVAGGQDMEGILLRLRQTGGTW